MTARSSGGEETEVVVRIAGMEDVPRIAPLFDAYRGFYRQPSDPDLALRFLNERAERKESILFVAESARHRGGAALGFAQVYPMFSSVRCTRAWILNDLFVAPDARRLGVGRALLRFVETEGRRADASYVELSTGNTNANARQLYESEGYKPDREFLHYTLYLKA